MCGAQTGKSRGGLGSQGKLRFFAISRPINPRQITALIKDHKGPGEMLRLLDQHGDDFNEIHCSSMWSALKRHPGWHSRGDGRRLVEPVAAVTARCLLEPEMDARGLANISHGLAKSGCEGGRPPWGDVFDALASESAQRVGEFIPQALANTSWAFATAGHSAPALFDALASASAPRVGEFNPQNLINTAWAFAADGADFAERAELNSALAQRLEQSEHDLSELELRQVHQWILWHREHGTAPPVSAALVERALAAFRASPTTPSKLQRSVGAVFAELGLQPRGEVICEETGYSVDLVVTSQGGTEVAVEVDGPTHFLVGRDAHTPTGATLLKRRQLGALGWPRLVSVPYWEWDALSHGEGGASGRRERERAYLLEAVQIADDAK